MDTSNADKLKELLDEYLADKKKEIIREKYRDNMRKYRENHREEHNAYLNNRSKELYQQNKAKYNELRKLSFRKKRERDILNGVIVPKKRGRPKTYVEPVGKEIVKDLVKLES